MSDDFKCLTVPQMQFLLRRHGYNYGHDAAENALVGYQLALTLVLDAMPNVKAFLASPSKKERS